jgi:glutaredoxin 3
MLIDAPDVLAPDQIGPGHVPVWSGLERLSLTILYEVMNKITVYTTDPCSFCSRVKALLSARGLDFAEVNLSRDPAGRLELAHKTGMMSFPQVLIDDRLLGGFTEVKAAADDGRLDELLAA